MFNPTNNKNSFTDLNNPYEYFGQNVEQPYLRGVNSYAPRPLPGNVSEDNLYPLESSLVTPQFNSGDNVQNFARGGKVQSDLPSLAELIRQQGNNEDSILAHINPIEALILKSMGGSGDINPRTGLPQFSFWNKPWKATRSSLGGIGGAIIGNMILPGIGGVIGGALGQGAQHSMRGKSFGEGALKGGSIGAMAPTAAGLAGNGLSSLGATSAGNFLSNYGAQNAILPSLSNLLGGGNPQATGISIGDSNTSLGNMISPKQAALSNLLGGGNSQATGIGDSNLQNNVTGGETPVAPQGFMDKLMGNSSDFFSKPANLLALASAAGSFAGRPKEKSPEKLASEKKRYDKASRLTAEERAALEADMLANRQMERRLAMNSYLPEERFAINPIYRKVASPEDYKKNKKWLSYYDNSEMKGNPLLMKKGGIVPALEIETIEIDTPKEGFYLEGQTGGQDDKIKSLLSDGEYVIPADVVSHLGDGNSNAGAKKFDDFLKKIRKHKGGKMNLPPKAKSLSSYILGGK